MYVPAEDVHPVTFTHPKCEVKMKEPVLTDPSQHPTEDVIFSHIGKAGTLWKQLFGGLHRDHPDFTEEWRYYRDGKSWLMKVQRKSKTVFWLSVFKGGFRTTFYLPVRASDAVSATGISPELKTQFRKGPRSGKIRGITVTYGKKRDVEDAQRLVDLKISLR